MKFPNDIVEIAGAIFGVIALWFVGLCVIIAQFEYTLTGNWALFTLVGYTVVYSLILASLPNLISYINKRRRGESVHEIDCCDDLDDEEVVASLTTRFTERKLYDWYKAHKHGNRDRGTSIEFTGDAFDHNKKEIDEIYEKLQEKKKASAQQVSAPHEEDSPVQEAMAQEELAEQETERAKPGDAEAGDGRIP